MSSSILLYPIPTKNDLSLSFTADKAASEEDLHVARGGRALVTEPAAMFVFVLVVE